MKTTFRLLIVSASLLFLAAGAASAQSVDAFFGVNALTASQAVQNIPKLGGGVFPSAGAEVRFGDIGVGAEVAFQANPQTFDATELRPIYYDVNLILEPFHQSETVVPVFMVGLGAQSLRAFQGVSQCGTPSGCTAYVSSNHLTAHLGIGVKLYLTKHIFLRPEAHFYFIHNNTEFAATSSQRWGISIGYTFGAH